MPPNTQANWTERSKEQNSTRVLGKKYRITRTAADYSSSNFIL